MDTTRPVTYRGLQLNDASIGVGGTPTSGNMLVRAQYGAVQGHAYVEKRSQSDGFDAGDVFLGMREVYLEGVLYGESRADLFDRKATLAAAFTPTGAYGESPGDLGFLPLAYEEPTKDIADWPSGYVPKMMRCRPVAQPEFTIDRDAIGGADSRGLAIPWSVRLEARDPRIYAQYGREAFFKPGGSNASSGVVNVTSRGDYPAPVFLDVWVPASVNECVFRMVGLGTTLTLRIPKAGGGVRVVRYDGREKYVTLEENSKTRLRMDIITLEQERNHPLVPPGGPHAIQWSQKTDAGTGINVHANTSLIFWEAFA
jgi:hypothetical protein